MATCDIIFLGEEDRTNADILGKVISSGGAVGSMDQHFGKDKADISERLVTANESSLGLCLKDLCLLRFLRELEDSY